MADIKSAWEAGMTHFPELLMNVVTAVPPGRNILRCLRAWQWAAASKGFTGISRQDFVVRLSNGQLQICSAGIWRGREEGRRGGMTRRARRLRSHTCIGAGLWFSEGAEFVRSLLRGWWINPRLWRDTLCSQWEVWSGGISDKLCHAIIQWHGELWGVSSTAWERSDYLSSRGFRVFLINLLAHLR